MKRIGLFGGTFDPPHKGHLAIANTALKELNLDKVILIPTYEPPHKQAATASPEERLEMLKRLIHGNDGLAISTIEFELGGASYTYDTIVHLQNRHPDTTFYFIIGGDMVDYLPNWYRIEDLKQLVTFVGVYREGYPSLSDETIKTLKMPPIAYASSKIKKELKEGTYKEGLTDSVYQYIKEQQLYER